MLNIIRSLNYTARRDTVNWIVIITMLVFPVFEMYIAGVLSGDTISKMTPSMYFASQQMGNVFIIMLFGTMIFSCKLVAGDAGDKTINYEFMAGHSREKIFVGRMLSGLLWGAGLTYIFTILPLFYLRALYGWGPETDQSDVILRSVLVIFPIIRTTTLFMMIGSISRSAGKGIALSYAFYMALTMITSVIQEVFEIDITYPTGMTNAAFILTSQNSRNVVMDGKTVMLFDTAVTGEMIWKTIVVSLVFTAAYMIITYLNFKKTDRD